MKNVVKTVLISISVILIAVIFKNAFSAYIPVHNRGIRAAAKAGDLDVLFIGSSTFRCNIDMHEMDEAFDNRVYDISYGGNQAIATTIQYDEFKKRSKNAHDLMVFELSPLLLTEEAMISDSRVIWDLSWNGKKRLWKKMRDSGNGDLDLMYEYFVTTGMDDLVTYPVTEPFYATRYYKGVKTGDTPSPGKDYLDNEEFDISDARLVEAQADAVKELAEKCISDGQRFVFLESPRYYRLQNDPTYKKYLDINLKILDEAGADYILASDVDFDIKNADYYEDMNHMSGTGRSVYTASLIPVLKSLK